MNRAGATSRGQGLVEFALVFPIIILVVVSFVEIGRAVYSYNTVTDAARQGARVAAVNQISAMTECDETRPVEDPLSAHWSILGCAVVAGTPLGIHSSDVTVSYAPPPSSTVTCSPTLHVGCIASVTVVYKFSISTPIVNNLIGPITMSSTSQMPVERVFP